MSLQLKREYIVQATYKEWNAVLEFLWHTGYLSRKFALIAFKTNLQVPVGKENILLTTVILLYRSQ